MSTFEFLRIFIPFSPFLMYKYIFDYLNKRSLSFRIFKVLIAIPSILLSFVLVLELRRAGLLAVFVKSFSIGILHKLFELPSDIGFHLRIFIV